MERHGFVYVWRDRKHCRYYIGRHWGTETDGYICSSSTVRTAKRRRPKDFKRRIVSRIYTTNSDLIKEEQRWLDMIPTDQFGKKFYNRSPKADTPSMLGKNHLPETIEKIKQSNTGLKRSLKTRQNNREANKRQFEDQAQREIRRQKSLELWTDPEYRRRQSEKKRGKKQSREQIEKRQRTIRERGHYERWSKERTGKPRGQWGAAFNS